MTQECPVCGQTYGLTHECAGAAPRPAAAEWTPPEGFAPWHYFRQALAVARFQDAAIIEASRDPQALVYGAIIWMMAMLLSYGKALLLAAGSHRAIAWPALIVGFGVAAVFGAMVTLAQYATCHLLARWWFGARGTLLGILRAMLLGWVVVWLYPIPYVGPLVGGLWGIAVLMRVFEEVDRIGRLQAFGLAVSTGLIAQLAAYFVLHPGR
jgi:hypothetical protein